MTQPQAIQRPLPDFLEDLQHAYPVLPSSGPDEKPNHEREAYKKAQATWVSSSLYNTASGRSYNDTRIDNPKLFISHELLKAGYTISDELYSKYCWPSA
jgi:hypothetical protein